MMVVSLPIQAMSRCVTGIVKLRYIESLNLCQYDELASKIVS
jgi:hypothetical protein